MRAERSWSDKAERRHRGKETTADNVEFVLGVTAAVAAAFWFSEQERRSEEEIRIEEKLREKVAKR